MEIKNSSSLGSHPRAEDDDQFCTIDMSDVRKAKLPKKLLIMSNPDKQFHESNYAERDLCDLVHPFRLLLFGPPNCGKTSTLRNVILRAGTGRDPPFEEIFLIHCDPDYTREYDDLDCELLTEIPAPDEWVGECKSLVILEDLEYKSMNKIQKRNLDRLYGYVSTHKNISVALLSQECISIPISVRRMSNFFILWRCPDLNAMANIASRTGIKKDQFLDIFERLMPDVHDSLWIDLSPGARFRLRKNGFQPIIMSNPSK